MDYAEYRVFNSTAMRKHSELILRPDGAIYHLDLRPEDIAPNVLLVGDPARVDTIGAFFDRIDKRVEHREFRTITGMYRDIPLSVLSTGIGTDKIDIVMNELDALYNIDFQSGGVHPTLRRFNLLRLGTCGSLQANVSPGTLIFSRHAIGAGELMSFYKHPQDTPLEKAWAAYKAVHFPDYLTFYCSSADEALSLLLEKEFPEVLQGITYTAPGFYGPQGRNIGRLSPALPDLPLRMAGFSYEKYRLVNMEMEAAAIQALSTALGHRAGALCVAIANRINGKFSESPQAAINHLVEQGLEIMVQWHHQAPSA